MDRHNITSLVAVTIALALAALRVAGFQSLFFQGVAHVFVGGLGGAWWVGRGRLHLVLFLGLTVVEVLCATLLVRSR